VPASVAVKFAHTVEERAHVVTVSCGYTHALLVCSDGALYSWGQGEYGQLGREGVGSSPQVGVVSVVSCYPLCRVIRCIVLSIVSCYPLCRVIRCVIFFVAPCESHQLMPLTGLHSSQPVPGAVGVPPNTAVAGAYCGAFHSVALCQR
jgi:hypothetical protein